MDDNPALLEAIRPKSVTTLFPVFFLDPVFLGGKAPTAVASAFNTDVASLGVPHVFVCKRSGEESKARYSQNTPRRPVSQEHPTILRHHLRKLWADPL